MLTDHGTFIIGFSVSKGHMTVAPEAVAVTLFKTEIEEAGYSHTEELFRTRQTAKADLDLLRQLIVYNIENKEDVSSFWRRQLGP